MDSTFKKLRFCELFEMPNLHGLSVGEIGASKMNKSIMGLEKQEAQ